MSTLTLVRHAQASFFAADYDRLSPLGEEQARLLGAYWARRGIPFDEVYTGPRVRQMETAALVGAVCVEAGLVWTRPVVLDELDEHRVDRLMKQSLHELTREYAHVATLAEAYRRAETDQEKHRGFQKLFEAVVHLWVDEDRLAGGVESWPEFRARVRAGLARITESEGRGRRVAVFTSVGAITVAMQAAIDCSDRAALELGWRVRNASISEFIFTRDRLTLDGFNAYPHLEDSRHWTYR